MTTASPPATRAPSGARIGPNAIIQLVAAIEHRWDADLASELLGAATPYRRETLPHDMVDEREPLAMVRLLMGRVGTGAARVVLRDAGVRTAEYLLANRIPPAAQWVTGQLPRRAGLALLLRAIGAHAWTFAGSGRFTVQWARGWPILRFTDCAMCRGLVQDQPVCDYYAGTFEHLFRTLVAPEITVTEVTCQAQGAPECELRVAGG